MPVGNAPFFLFRYFFCSSLFRSYQSILGILEFADSLSRKLLPSGGSRAHLHKLRYTSWRRY